MAAPVSLPPNRKLILQIHYKLAAGSFPDQTSVKLKLSSQVDLPAIMGVVGTAYRLEFAMVQRPV